MAGMSKSEPATKQDVEEIVGRVVGEIVGSALQLISDQFDGQNKQIAELQATTKELQATTKELQATTNRIENKLDPTIDQVDDHEVRLKRLESKAA